MKRLWFAALIAAAVVAGWLSLVAARCPGKCPLCP